MLTDEHLLSKVKLQIETRLGWGNSADWTNQDFVNLSSKFKEDFELSISHVTLKRIWGKVKYAGMPQIYTLNALAEFAGFENWRNFKVRLEAETSANTGFSKIHFRKIIGISAALLVFVAIVLIFAYPSKKKFNVKNYSLSIHKILSTGLPNSVIFNYDAGEAVSDSVIIQQSWDDRLRTTVSKNQHQHTLIYYYPGFFNPKLIVDGEIVNEQKLLIPSNGWMAAVSHTPVPIYFKKEEVIADGKMELPIDLLKEKNIPLSPEAPLVSYCNVQDFGPIYADHFHFETSLRNDYSEGSSVCQLTNIYLLCEGTAIGIPLCVKGCESSINFFFAGYSISGKQKDLSAFGVDFDNYVKVRVESADGKAFVFLNDKLAYEVPGNISHTKIIGIDYVFQGTGSVNYVKLTNENISFEDKF
ncbi:MAG TPA: hypothetical protein VK772_08880 [Puia sp.]|nr:hypothetical protein [Puia sp.]